MDNFVLYTLLKLPGILIGLSLHEFSHALAADKLGDPTPRGQGRLTIEPWSHIDIFGFLFLIFVGFGWAKPVYIDPRNFKKPRRDDTIVSLAGPLANLFTAILFGFITSILLKTNVIGMLSGDIQGYILVILYFIIWINLILMVFNLIPIPPLDGSHILANILPPKYRIKYQNLYQYSAIIIIVIFVLSWQVKGFTQIITFPAAIVYKMILLGFGIPDFLGIV